MKKSELKEFIREEIISVLSEAATDEFDTDTSEPTAADLKKTNSLAKNAAKLAATEKEMKTVVNQWKKSEGKEKEDLLKRLKTLTQIKKELEALVNPSMDDDEI